ncbi:hypothetical protein TSTA_060610 [Talaromyces stipitatus ATCC 10500]|uniref:Uncharacterized protein n=1 Tax=Talaromyces stipitatus (strain ATCC 10500 / CBS 375.48 / QM 6759 / NRRL 1006) TaxID=441959 RepID=B8LU97_TALSN|nr:uncharacterized protein TSTA_060610 [Talaromyces stipitatus ATCC 10500]EED22569.1 hypothetical protein TSTA_060610 [Talaromyces stipitatus ATCC 10500]
MHTFFKSPFFNFEFLRLLAMAPFEGGEIAEILEASMGILKVQRPVISVWWSGRRIVSPAKTAIHKYIMEQLHLGIC